MFTELLCRDRDGWRRLYGGARHRRSGWTVRTDSSRSSATSGGASQGRLVTLKGSTARGKILREEVYHTGARQPGRACGGKSPAAHARHAHRETDRLATARRISA